MSRVEFESTIPVFERVKAFHALDRAATVTVIALVHSAFSWNNSFQNQSLITETFINLVSGNMQFIQYRLWRIVHFPSLWTKQAIDE
jgi:hypothetical protein